MTSSVLDINDTAILYELKPVFDGFLIDALKQRHALQGHTLTGELENSIESDVNASAGTIEYSALFYAEYTNRGVSADNIPYSPGSGKKTSEYIKGLMRYAKLRFRLDNEKDQKSAAFAIARKHKNEGMPTAASKQFSRDKNSSRTKWIDMTLEEKENEIRQTIEDVVFKIINLAQWQPS